MVLYEGVPMMAGSPFGFCWAGFADEDVAMCYLAMNPGMQKEKSAISKMSTVLASIPEDRRRKHRLLFFSSEADLLLYRKQRAIFPFATHEFLADEDEKNEANHPPSHR